MDGANMNAIAGIVNLGSLGVDAVHNNLHKTWTIPHGGGGPGDAIVAVSEKLVDFLPGKIITQDEEGLFRSTKPKFSIGSFHRHWGNFGHKVRAYSYLLRLGKEGVPRMSSTAVLSSRYLFAKLGKIFPTLPACEGKSPRMHEFILTLSEEDFAKLEKVVSCPLVSMPHGDGLLVRESKERATKHIYVFGKMPCVGSWQILKTELYLFLHQRTMLPLERKSILPQPFETSVITAKQMSKYLERSSLRVEIRFSFVKKQMPLDKS